MSMSTTVRPIVTIIRIVVLAFIPGIRIMIIAIITIPRASGRGSTIWTGHDKGCKYDMRAMQTMRTRLLEQARGNDYHRASQV